MSRINKLRPAIYLTITILVLTFYFFSQLPSLNQQPFWGTVSGMDNAISGIRLRDNASSAPEIIIIAIDEKSINQLGNYPWKRSVHADLINKITAGGAAVFAPDMLFTEQSEPSEDDCLVKAIKESNRVIIPVNANFEYGGSTGTTDDGVLKVNRFIYPIPEIKSAAAGLGHINAFPENYNGILRRALTDIYSITDNETIPCFASSIYTQYTGKPAPIPKNHSNRPFIHFLGPPGSGVIEVVSYSDVITGIIPPEYFNGKIVFAGPFSAGFADDNFRTPASGVQEMYGVEIHATLLANMLNSEMSFPAPSWANWLFLLTAAVLFLLIVSRSFSPMISTMTFLISIAIYIGIYTLVFITSNLILTIVPIIFLFALIFLSDLLIKYITEALEKKRIISVFGRYAPPQVVNKIIDEGDSAIQLGGENREITVIFVDIRGFTPLSENLNPHEIVDILNKYLGMITHIIFDYEGILDKYIGDAAMAIFNAPLDIDDHVFKAVSAAVAMRKQSEAISTFVQEKYGRSLGFGIGVNTGQAVVGNIGADIRMDYTAIGDTVNTAARFESNAKAGQVLVSKKVYEMVADRVVGNYIGALTLKGKSEPQDAYEISDIL